MSCEPEYKIYLKLFGFFFGKELNTGNRKFFVFGRETKNWYNIIKRFSIG